jgi:hypothetical protein
MAINNTSLTTVATPVYSSTGNSAITTIHLCNYTSSPIQANVYAVPSGSSANNTTVIYANVTVTAFNTLIIYQEKFILGNGDAIYANVSANSAVTGTVSAIGI